MNNYALVTGAACGLGFEFSKLLARDSFNLVLVDKNINELESAKLKLEKEYATGIEVIVHDLSEPYSASFIYEKVKDRNIDILINNAGYGLCGFFYRTSWELEEGMIMLHVLTTTQLTKLFLADMVSRGRGRIMNVSSVAAFQPGPLMAVYYSTKAYLLSFTEAIANELKGTGVTVTVFCPGQTDTNFQETLAILSKTQKSKSPWIADPVRVARQGYIGMKAGKVLVIPGPANKVLAQLHRIVPRQTAASLVRLLQESIRK